MDVQLKRGLLEVCVLAAIVTEDSYGYQIVRDMKPYVEISESTLYPILRRLESANCLTVRSAEHNGRLRKYYHITEQGYERIEEFKKEWKEILSIYQFIVREDKGDEKAGIPRGVVEATV
ncbi:MAG: PadR family transcriptional regulator [Eubacterium sp.]|nr:PadR family transcriptional regulator [Eubacterium sp.]